MVVVIVKLLTPEEEGSSESSFAVSWCRHEAEEAFGRHCTRIHRVASGSDSPDFREADWVLLLGKGDILVGRRTLRALLEALEEGADLAIPQLLANTRAAQEHPANTLSDLELIEKDLLEGGALQEMPMPSSPPPVALFRASFLREALERSPQQTLFDPELLSQKELATRAVVRGVCHHYQDYYGETREDIMPFVPASAREVLEVGCGRGHTGALLQERLGCQVTGVELNPVVARDASRRLSRVVTGDFLKVPLEGPYDAILALELFEHLVDGELFLERAKSLLAPHGVLILSVPNVGHHAIVSDLLAGRWDYIPAGLLCCTHVRFFTRKTLSDWLSRCGFRRFDIKPQKSDVPERLLEAAEKLGGDTESLATSGFYVVARPDE